MSVKQVTKIVISPWILTITGRVSIVSTSIYKGGELKLLLNPKTNNFRSRLLSGHSYSRDHAHNLCTSPTLACWDYMEDLQVLSKVLGWRQRTAHLGGRTQSRVHGRGLGWVWMNVQTFHFLVNWWVSKIHIITGIFLLHWRHWWWQSGHELIKSSYSLGWAVNPFFHIPT